MHPRGYWTLSFPFWPNSYLSAGSADDHTVLEAVHCMVESNVGAVPVLKDGELAGIFSECDVMKRVMVRAIDPMSLHPNM